MQEPVSAIRNIGPALEKEFSKAGLSFAQQVRDLGADAAYALLLAHGVRPHFIGYYALVMGLQGRPWNDCQGSEKQDLRKRFDKIKATSIKAPAGHDEFERMMDQIGIIER